MYGSAEKELSESQGENQREVGGLFVKVATSSSNRNDRDESRPPIASYLAQAEKMLDRIEELKSLICDCFVTGDWGDEDATRLLAEDDEELFGDFEDLEEGAEQGLGEEDSESENEQAMDTDKPAGKDEEEDEKTKKQKIWEKKMKLKAAFNQEYDDKVRHGNVRISGKIFTRSKKQLPKLF